MADKKCQLWVGDARGDGTASIECLVIQKLGKTEKGPNSCAKKCTATAACKAYEFTGGKCIIHYTKQVGTKSDVQTKLFK